MSPKPPTKNVSAPRRGRRYLGQAVTAYKAALLLGIVHGREGADLDKEPARRMRGRLRRRTGQRRDRGRSLARGPGGYQRRDRRAARIVGGRRWICRHRDRR